MPTGLIETISYGPIRLAKESLIDKEIKQLSSRESMRQAKWNFKV